MISTLFFTILLSISSVPKGKNTKKRSFKAKNNYYKKGSTKKVRKSTEPKRAPFTNEEISSVLRAFKNDTFTPNKSAFKHSHYYPFIYFLFKTGVRNAEAIGLRVSSIDLQTNQIHIKEAFARSLKGSSYKNLPR